MLNQITFKTGMEELILAFNLELGQDQIKIWYKHCKKLSDSEFKKKIESCIMNCNHKPYIADLANAEIEQRPQIEYV